MEIGGRRPLPSLMFLFTLGLRFFSTVELLFVIEFEEESEKKEGLVKILMVFFCTVFFFFGVFRRVLCD